ncbi:hypothetical protein V5O48_012492 [Marasmius crinis-equi]|uniref:Uncharacterized protein n=1 Tax=Marasmius crinis-equi TaxID=585013 RepID=A0ABR3F2Y0_9AGAR
MINTFASPDIRGITFNAPGGSFTGALDEKWDVLVKIFLALEKFASIAIELVVPPSDLGTERLASLTDGHTSTVCYEGYDMRRSKR